MKNQILLSILLLILVVAFVILYTVLSSGDEFSDDEDTVDGFAGLDKFDIDPIFKINKTLKFSVSPQDMPKFIELVSDKGLVPYKEVIIPPKNPNFPGVNEGRCYSDESWRAIKLNGVQVKKNVGGGTQTNNYNQCKAFAESKGANVFGLQYGNECWVGNSAEIALSMQSRNASECNRRNFPRGTGGGWTQMVYAKELPKKKNQFDESAYRKFISDLLDSGIKSYSDLNNSIRVNENFTARKSEYSKQDSPTQYLDMSDIVQTSQAAKVGVNNKVIPAFGEFKVQRGDYSSMVNSANSKQDIKNYVGKMTEHGFNSKYESNVFVDGVNSLQPGYASTHNLTDTVSLMQQFGITVADIVNVKTRDPGPFTVNAKLIRIDNGRAGIPLFPVPNSSKRSVMTDLAAIGVNSQTVFTYLGVFSEKGVSANVYFTKIHPILISDKFQFHYTDEQKLREFIANIAISGNLAKDFETFGTTIASLGIKNYVDYIAFIGALKQSVGVPSDLTQLMPKFKTYMSGPAYETPKDSATVDTNTLLQFIGDLQTNGYGLNANSDFNQFLDKLNKQKYSVQNLHRDIKIGQTYSTFMGQQTAKKEGFLGGIMRSIEGFYGGIKEALSTATPSQSDYAALISFGISDFGDPLTKWETTLAKYGNTGWTNLIKTTDNLAKLGLTANDIDAFAKLMSDFGAKTVDEWISILQYLGNIGLKGIVPVSGFIRRIVDFGVNYKTNYTAFLQNLSVFVGPNANQMNISNLYIFLDDMTNFGYTYKTAPDKVNTIMQYFGQNQIYLHMYVSEIHDAIVKMYNYSKSAGSICPHNLNDFDLKVSQQSSSSQSIIRGLKLAANPEKYAEYTMYISSYLFQEEVYGMKNATGPNDSATRIAMFQDVARAIMSDSSPKEADTMKKTRNEIANMCGMFPCIMFEICMNNIQKSCANNKCDYILRSDPGNQLSRAATIRPDKTPRKIVVLNNSRIVNVNAITPNQTSS